MSGSEHKHRTAAFIDVDGTLLTVQSARLYIAFLRRKGLVSTTDWLRILLAAVAHRLGFLDMRRLVLMSSRFIRGRSEEETLAHCREWFATELRGHFRTEMLAVIEEHRRAGHLLALLTGSTRHVAGLIAAELGIGHLLVTELETIDGRFTGKAVGPVCFGKGKVAKARTFASEHGIDLGSSYFYSDSISDLPMLESVGHPCVVDPDPRLGLEAQRRSWPVLGATRRRALVA